MQRHLDASAFVLGGGASARMAAEKGLLSFGGEPLVRRTVRLIEPLVREVAVVGRPALYSHLGLHTIPDKPVRDASGSEVRASLVGIVTALTSSASTWNLVLACDLPYLTREWIGWLLARALASRSQIVMPRTSRGLEPLAAIYRQECAAPILIALESGIRKVTDALAGFQMEFVEETEWRELDPGRKVLINMNTPEDYHEAQQWWETHSGAE